MSSSYFHKKSLCVCVPQTVPILTVEGTPDEVITEEAIREAYGVEVNVHVSSRTGTPMVLPTHAVRRTEYRFSEE